MDEEYGKLYKKLYGLDTYGLRYFNVFGRRQDPNGAYAAVIPKFIRQLLHGEVPTINGDGKQSRDFTYIDNVIEANMKACLAPSEAAGQAFNIAYGGREYLIDIYYDLCKALDKRWSHISDRTAQGISSIPMRIFPRPESFFPMIRTMICKGNCTGHRLVQGEFIGEGLRENSGKTR